MLDIGPDQQLDGCTDFRGTLTVKYSVPYKESPFATAFRGFFLLAFLAASFVLILLKMKISQCLAAFGLVAGVSSKGLRRHAPRDSPVKSAEDRIDHGQTSKYIIETEPVSPQFFEVVSS